MMAALDFPNPPLTVGQQFTATNGVAYQWDGAVWTLVPLPGAFGPASGDLQGSYPAPTIAPGAVDDDEIANVTWAKLLAPFLGVLKLDPRAAFAAGGGEISWHGNNPGDPNFDNTRASWIVRIDYVNDAFQIWRAPPPGITWALLFQVALSGISMNVPITLPPNSVGSTQIIDGSIQAVDLAPGIIGPGQLAPGAVDRAHLGINAIYGGASFAGNPANFSVQGPVGWTTVKTLTAFNTRGGFVFLVPTAGLSVAAPLGGVVYLRWVRDGVQIIQNTFLVLGVTEYSPIPELNWIDNPGAGSHTYSFQVSLDTAQMVVLATNQGGGLLLALEVG